MRRVLVISGFAAAGAVVIAAAITAYALYNLTAIIDRNQQRILNRVSNALGRPVQVGQIKARIGWGLAIEVDDLKIADDPEFSKDPFLVAEQVSMDVKFVPLLHGRVKVHRLDLIKPNVRVLKNTEGRFNVGTIRGAGEIKQGAHRRWRGKQTVRGIVLTAVEEVSIKSLGIEEGTLLYSDARLKGAPLQVSHINSDMTGFHTGSAFDVDVRGAVFSDQPNIAVSGKMGPILRQGVPDIPHCPLDLKFNVGPVTVDNLRTLVAPGSIVPATLSMPDPVSPSGTITGSLQDIVVDATSSLSGYRVIYRAASNKPATAPLTLVVTGKNGVRGTIRLLDTPPNNDLTAEASQVGVKFEGAQLPAISDLNAKVRLTAGRVVVEPTSFTVGAGLASVDATADSINPLKAAFTVKANSLQLSRIVPSRPPGEFVNRLAVSGTAGGQLSAPLVNARIKSASGLVEHLAYNNLEVTGTYADNRVSAQPLSMAIFDGSVLANINTILDNRHPFNTSLSFRHINVRDAMRWQNFQTHAITGFMTGDVRASGSGTKWGAIVPTLRGSGRVFLSGGALEGVNIVAIALNKIALAPVVSQLVSVAFRSSHEGLFASSGTDLRQASMDFTLAGPRVTTPDLSVQSPEYQITGAGWFDFDKNIDMNGDIRLTLGLSAAIPVVVMGKYPDLLVLPNIPKLAERVAVGVVNAPLNIIKEGVNGLGSVFGGIKSILP
jgi:uncharacterized protein involved in outer membrane biogenesis